ncbi:MAG: phytanoyl-CoA dioxygenase family protein, partial [Gammaproteobacteria bacterium]|nr:phytanoyl-CoA dioxygenase family protein [Gammaproteobacteria bacterium]
MINTRFAFTKDDLAAFARDGFLITRRVLDDAFIARLRERFEALFRGEFETGVSPDEVNWREGESDPALTRQICNGWKADRTLAQVTLAAPVGEAIARLAGWSGARVIQDNALWKPPGARALGMHQDNAYLAWYAPREMLSCWIPLDDTTAAGGTLVIARGSHRWSRAPNPPGAFHAPDDYTAANRESARE